jgi:glycosyltransferase involved in cell wall biosynthesis
MLSILIPCRNEENIYLFVDELEAKFPHAHEIIVARDREGKGKGWALREAFMESKGEAICFIDGDGEIPVRMLNRLLPFLEDFDVIAGSKRITKSPLRRKVMTRVTRWWFKLLFGVKCDTQTGIKLFKREALDSLDFWASNGWIFDVEIIARLQEKGFKIVEVPIECEIKRQLAITTIWRIFCESLWLKCRLSFRRKQ